MIPYLLPVFLPSHLHTFNASIDMRSIFMRLTKSNPDSLNWNQDQPNWLQVSAMPAKWFLHMLSPVSSKSDQKKPAKYMKGRALPYVCERHANFKRNKLNFNPSRLHSYTLAQTKPIRHRLSSILTQIQS